ncbi:hypothetical protein ACM26V_21185 [Salipaludibacillus sp. HK11]|uniref:hypothetical protein n=1 Tax=Salipaludibacillus sp. HK11 TaxID=3394320 RepID=UPI0039FDC9C4
MEKDIEYKYIRGHGLLHEDIGIYKEVETTDQTITFDFTMTKNVVTVIELSSVKNETETYKGLDDSLISSWNN